MDEHIQAGRRLMVGCAFAAIGWIILAWNVFQALPSAEASLILGVIALAESVASLLVRQEIKRTLHQKLEDCLALWAAFTVIILLLSWYSELPFFKGSPLALLCFLGLSLCVSLLRLFHSHMQGTSALWCSFSCRIWVLAMICPAISWGTEPTQTVVLFASVLVVLLQLCFALDGSRPSLDDPMTGRLVSRSSTSLMAQMDLLMLPIFLGPILAWPYLIARGVGFLPRLALTFLDNAAEPKLADMRTGAGRLVATAGRINLGSLLIGGASALMVLAAIPLVAQHFRLEDTDFRSIAMWIAFANFAPALLGATAVLLRAVGMQRELAWIQIFCSGLFCSALLLGSDKSGIDIAKALAASTWLASILGAALLAKNFGIWPGITALLFRQIRLF
ncbi:hypothetical protein [Sulfitobacter sp. M368]|uniref:hypothetical protein n=1 Tax=Sulfitobacter sp. M368 TaxID=2867021 RepID=UPI0021A45112|nr:hypothetical protein [Sulfitobacter sp. M368]UWR15253.1 hypothetical protein K3754_18580 [Sulfitobacter sp. M368]